MTTLFNMARHPLAALTRKHDATVTSLPASDAADRYERERALRLEALEAAGKCLARPGKHANLRYWPADRGSRVLSEYRRRRHPSGRLSGQAS